MAKNLSGDLQVASANRLIDGMVVWLEILLERARAEASSVIDPFLVAVTEDDDATIEPLSLREKIRASGLTFEAIAADAVRYA